MVKKPLVTIIVNNYNYERFLAEAIDSALNQTYKNIEVIVVDDASTDNSREVIEGYGEQVIKVFREKNGKQGAALNDGFAVSKGEIVIFLDADDYLFPQAMENIVRIWRPNVAKVHYRLQVVDTNRIPTDTYYPAKSQTLAKGKVHEQLLEKGNYISVPMSGNAYSKSVLTEIFPIDEEYKLTADNYLKFSTPFYGELDAIDEPLGGYRIHESNQWAMTEVSASRFRRFIHHDLVNYKLLRKKAAELSQPLPKNLEILSLGSLWSRLISFRLEPKEHPIPDDSCLNLTIKGLQSLWKYSQHSLSKKLVYTVWFFCVGFMPLPIAKIAISWLYVPYSRPKVFHWKLGKASTLLRSYL